MILNVFIEFIQSILTTLALDEGAILLKNAAGGKEKRKLVLFLCRKIFCFRKIEDLSSKVNDILILTQKLSNPDSFIFKYFLQKNFEKKNEIEHMFCLLIELISKFWFWRFEHGDSFLVSIQRDFQVGQFIIFGHHANDKNANHNESDRNEIL